MCMILAIELHSSWSFESLVCDGRPLVSGGRSGAALLITPVESTAEACNMISEALVMPR